MKKKTKIKPKKTTTPLSATRGNIVNYQVKTYLKKKKKREVGDK